jgi:signal recognition particle GTPase
MFENLQEKLQRAFKNLRGQGTLTPDNIQEALKEIRLALLEADVNFKVVKQFIDRVAEKAVGQEVMTALSPAQQVVNHHVGQAGGVAKKRRPSAHAGVSRRIPSGGAAAA